MYMRLYLTINSQPVPKNPIQKVHRVSGHRLHWMIRSCNSNTVQLFLATAELKYPWSASSLLHLREVVWHKTHHRTLWPNRFPSECPRFEYYTYTIGTNTTSCCWVAIPTASKQEFDFSSEEMARSADYWISLLGLVEHPGDEDGEWPAANLRPNQACRILFRSLRGSVSCGGKRFQWGTSSIIDCLLPPGSYSYFYPLLSQFLICNSIMLVCVNQAKSI